MILLISNIITCVVCLRRRKRSRNEAKLNAVKATNVGNPPNARKSKDQSEYTYYGKEDISQTNSYDYVMPVERKKSNTVNGYEVPVEK